MTSRGDPAEDAVPAEGGEKVEVVDDREVDEDGGVGQGDRPLLQDRSGGRRTHRVLRPDKARVSKR